ncbi:formylglycine-generating enzyme family protein [Lentibacillus saliphilus]|uniref:formylglycine-generating enzyme family protein n=1 Tax=Lentibacillus saliphilus TaxID=2737028 RepID=UPI001C2F79EB|nr:formylglycine-generating enzyme family protein [Lentibacillus saliphilus]
MTDKKELVQPKTQLDQSANHVHHNMVYIPGGDFLMGTNDKSGFPADGEGPIRKVTVKPFYMDVHTVTNQQFQAFIEDTGYVTEAEQFGWSFVFHVLIDQTNAQFVRQRVQQTPWWLVVEGATWAHPEGPNSCISDRMDHPVTHVSWHDADAYCQWAGLRLPTEAEWEYAARGGLEQKTYAWGDELTPNGEHYCNIWQGQFPTTNTVADGYVSTAPAKSFPENGYGLFNVAGNVWEWCSDWFATNIHKRGGRENPTGPVSGTSRVMRGGSYLCHHSYCNRYRVAARTSNTPDSSTGNIGFRCVKDV